MFGFFFGWRKAYKCKKLIRRVQCRLKLLESKRSVMAKMLKEDIARFLKNGLDQFAFNKLDELYEDENLKEVYKLLDKMCEGVVTNLSYISRHRHCPNNINEAVSSLIFASARLGNLPELQYVRKFFTERYGHRFAATALELLPGNLVNRQLQDKLSKKIVPEEAKNWLLDDIIRSCFFNPGLPALEYEPPNTQHALGQMKEPKCNFEFEVVESEMEEAMNPYELEGHFLKIDHPVYEKMETSLCLNFDAHSQQSEGILSTGTPITIQSPPRSYAALSPAAKALNKVNRSTHSASEMSSSACPESSHVAIYEFQSPVKEQVGVHSQDQRVFVFKPCGLDHQDPEKSEELVKGYEGQTDEERLDEIRGKRNNGGKKSAKKRMRRRSTSKEQPAVNNSGWERESNYYHVSSTQNSPLQNQRSRQHHRKHQKKNHAQEIVAQDYNCLPRNDKGRDLHPKLACEAQEKYTNDDDNVMELFCFFNEKEARSLDDQRRRDSTFRAIMSPNIIWRDKWHNGGSREVRMSRHSSVDTRSCSPSIREGKMVNNYSRVTTRDSSRGQKEIATSSCPLPSPVNNNQLANSSPRHVHPKLPDYDEIAAKFKALKEARSLSHPAKQTQPNQTKLSCAS